MRKFLLLFLLLVASGYAEVRIAGSLEPIEQEISSSGKETLILLDIGGTLVNFRDAAMHKEHQPWKVEWFHRNYPDLTREKYLECVRIVEASLNWHLADSNWPELIEKAQKKNLKTVAFTKVVMDSSTQGLRSTKLKSLGILLKDELPELTSGNFYEYADGVIETGAPLKGPVLQEVLSHLSLKPKKIIFVDDKLEQINSVNGACAEAGITCVAFHYIPIEEISPLNEIVFDYQFRTLVEERRWISEKEALELLEQK